uniref:RNA helicase n=1 Tax=Cyprinus carpio TaxID=7962 RepID=A0A8C2D1Z1_CYPCA
SSLNLHQNYSSGSRAGSSGGGGYTRNSEWDSREERGHGGERRGGGGGGRGKHPPHLKGREIGLWYAKYGGIKRSEAERKSVKLCLPSSYFDGDDPPEPQNIVKVPKIEPKEEKQENEDELGASVKEELNDTDLEYLFQDVVRIPSLDEELKKDQQKKKDNARYLDMLELVRLINANQVLVISGETGCGKTTQVTQFILDDFIQRGMGSLCRVVCTQPRRISAISVAERVAAERAESVGEGKSCGYQIRLQCRLPRKQGSVLYCTTGIILQWLRSDPYLSSVSHLILDEIHERSLQSDVLLSIVKDLLTAREDLKVVLMSATLNAEKFSKYFNNCSMIHIPGYTYPVKEYLLEDVPQHQDRRPRYRRGFMHGQNVRPEKEQKEAEYRESWPCFARTLRDRYSDSTIDALEMMDDDDKINLELIVALIRHIVMKEDNGAILAFLPGWDNISTLNDLLMADQMFKSGRCFSLLVFKKPPPGVRKIVIATNIAETRVSPGKCYHLYNGLRASLLDNYQLPEIQRTPLEELCLQIKILKLGPIASFLRKTMDPPADKAIELAITHLVDLNALDRNEELTPLGFHLARMPVEPHIGKMILFGALLGCLDPVLTIAASLSFKDPFFIPLGKEKIADKRRKILSRNSRSDHLTIVNALWGWEDAKKQGSRFEKEYCWENFLSANTLQMLQNMKGQFAEHLLAAGFVNSKDPKDPSSNINSENEKLIKAVIVAGLYPKVAKIRPNHSKKRPMPVKVYTKADGKVCIHPKSVNAEETQFHYTWLIYHLKMKTTSLFLYDCTEVSPFSLLFFGGDISIQRDQDQETIAVDEWIVFQSPARIAHLVKDLRKELDMLLEEKIKNPRPVVWNDRRSKDCAVLSAIIDLITTQETPAGGPRRGSQ